MDQFLAKLDQSSTDESDGEEKQSPHKSRGKRHSLKSGKASKLTSRVVTPQLWPHSHLSLSYISKEKKYDDLTLAEFAGGYAAVLQRSDLSPVELCTRIEHLSSLMYLATQFTWPSVRELHAAVLFEMECGWAHWGDSFTHLENRILQPSSRQSRAGATCTENFAAVFFCRDFQHGVCKFSKDHYGTLRGECKWFQHICAHCWVDSRLSARHTEFSKDCPLKGEMPKAANAMETSASHIPVSQDCPYLPFQDFSGPDIINFVPDVCDVQDLTLDDQDLVFHNSGLYLQDFINDSRLKIINVSQDSRLSVQDTSLPDLHSSMQEEFIQDLRSDNLTELTVPSVCELDTPSNPHDTTIDVLSFEADVSLSWPQDHSTVTFKDCNVVSFSSSLDHPVSNAFAP